MSSRIKNSLIAMTMFIFSSITYADDIDILYAEKPIGTNILFVMDLSGSMDELVVGQTKTRLQSLSSALQTIVNLEDFEGVNFGVSVFSGGGGSEGFARGISYPVSPAIGVNAQDVLNSTGFTHSNANSTLPDAGSNNTREYISLLTTTWSAQGSTPIVDALYEAARYFRGENVSWGRHPPVNIRSAHPSTYAYTAPDGNFTNQTTLVTPAGTVTQSQTRTDPTGGTNCSANTGNTCSTNSATSCGLGSNCTTLSDFTANRFCFAGESQSDCSTRKPNWINFTSYIRSSCTTNDGNTVCTDTPSFRAQEILSRTTCDAPDTYTCDFLVDVPERYENQTVGDASYNSPIAEECSANAIILLTDGAPTENRSADLMLPMIGSYANSCNTDSSVSEVERCGPELAEFLSNEDHNSSITGLQSVETYAVGFALAATDPAKIYLDKIAKAGDIDKKRTALTADNEAQLVKAFTDTINDVVGKARSFSSPSYTVDTSTSLTNGSYVYIPVFDRAAGLWPGNLKKFKISSAGVLLDDDDKPALDPSTGALKDDAKDLWSSVPSTNSVLSGGAANKINPTTRNVLTDNGDILIPLSNSVPNLQFGLTDSVADTNLKQDLVTFIKGTNPADNTVRNHMGDIIHSKPVQLKYANDKTLIFIGSNEGYLHAFNDHANNNDDATNGTEEFVYMPKDLLKNIKDQYSGLALEKHIYGVDGEITLWLDESDNLIESQVGNNVLDAGEKAYIFFGLRRGGSTYTVLDVTDPETPSLVMSESFDVPGKVAVANSWSQPVVANLLWGSNTKAKPVMIVGGGFNDDDSGETTGGNNVYVVDFETGDIVWDTTDAFGGTNKVSNFIGNALPNAVPSRIRVIDIDRDNSVDRLYFSDTGANIWRVDLNAAKFDADTTNDNDIKEATLHRVAELGGSGINDRQFFEEPDVAIFKRRGKLVASIAIGSGSRPNPLSTAINDKFFVIYDKAVTSIPNSTDNPLITVTGTYGLETVPVSKSARLDPNYVGWQQSLSSTTGEKVLSSALTFQGKVLFTTFGVLSASTDACNPGNINENKLYVLDIFGGIEDLVTTYPGGEILDTPKIIYPPGGTCQTGDCKRVPKIAFGKVLLDFPESKDENGDVKVDIFGNPLPAGGDVLERVYWIDSDKK